MPDDSSYQLNRSPLLLNTGRRGQGRQDVRLQKVSKELLRGYGNELGEGENCAFAHGWSCMREKGREYRERMNPERGASDV